MKEAGSQERRQGSHPSHEQPSPQLQTYCTPRVSAALLIRKGGNVQIIGLILHLSGEIPWLRNVPKGLRE